MITNHRLNQPSLVLSRNTYWLLIICKICTVLSFHLFVSINGYMHAIVPILEQLATPVDIILSSMKILLEHWKIPNEDKYPVNTAKCPHRDPVSFGYNLCPSKLCVFLFNTSPLLQEPPHTFSDALQGMPPIGNQCSYYVKFISYFPSFKWL